MTYSDGTNSGFSRRNHYVGQPAVKVGSSNFDYYRKPEKSHGFAKRVAFFAYFPLLILASAGFAASSGIPQTVPMRIAPTLKLRRGLMCSAVLLSHSCSQSCFRRYLFCCVLFQNAEG